MAEFVPVLRVTESSHSAAQVLVRAAGEARKRLRTLEELIADKTLMTAPNAVLPFVAYEGRCTLISAREKCGKSTLLSQGAVAVTTGGFFLGERVPKGRVLWYALDEPFKDAVQRLHRFGAEANQIVLPEHSSTAANLEADCAEVKPNLVVIDTLARLLFANGIDLMAGRGIEQFLQPVMDVVRRHNAALVLIHHTNKRGDEYTGSIHLGAIVDGPLTLKKAKGRPPASDEDDPEDDAEGEEDEDDIDDTESPVASDGDTRRVLEGQTRWGYVRLKLRFDERSGRYVMYTLSEYLTDRITSELAKAPAGMSGNALQEAIGGNRGAIFACLGRGGKAGLWFRSKNKWFLNPAPAGSDTNPDQGINR